MNHVAVFLGLSASLWAAAGICVPAAGAPAAPPARGQGSGRGYQVLQELGARAQAALEAGDTRSATKFAAELLRKNTDRSSWNYGNVVYEANQILGLAALREGRVAAAKRHLLAAGRTPGSPQLNSFGPEMTLAQALLGKGEKQAVLDFLDLVARFWATPRANTRPEFRGMYEQHAAKIRRWNGEIRAGGRPALNRVAAS